MTRGPLIGALCVMSASMGAYLGLAIDDSNQPERVEECIFGLLFITDPEQRANITTQELATICEFPVKDMDEIRELMEDATDRGD